MSNRLSWQGPALRRGRSDSTKGTTLVELLVVVLSLSVLASAVIYATRDAVAEAETSTTGATMTAARDGIVGARQGEQTSCYLQDCGRLPATIADLLRQPAGVPAYDPATGAGWRGPYVIAPRATYDASLPSFGAAYGVHGDPALLDGYGVQIVLQIPDADGDGVSTPEDLHHARLVSAGLDGVLEVPAAGPSSHYPPLASCGDDLVVYLRVADLRPGLPP